MNMFKTIMRWSCLTKIFPDVPTVPAPPTSDDAGTCESGPFFSKACIYYLLSLLIYESGGLGSWWQYVGFFPRCAHDTAAVYTGISARRNKTHTVNSLDFGCPQHQGLPLFKSKYLTEVSDRRSAIILRFGVWRFHRRPTTERNHQVRGCPLAGKPSKCTSPLCCVAHYVVSALILHKWDAHHRLRARSISQPCNTCRHKMVLMPRLVFFARLGASIPMVRESLPAFAENQCFNTDMRVRMC